MDRRWIIEAHVSVFIYPTRSDGYRAGMRTMTPWPTKQLIEVECVGRVPLA